MQGTGIRMLSRKDRQNRKSQQAGDLNPVTTVLFKTISIGLIADGPIFKGLICHFRFAAGYSAMAS